MREWKGWWIFKIFSKVSSKFPEAKIDDPVKDILLPLSFPFPLQYFFFFFVPVLVIALCERTVEMLERSKKKKRINFVAEKAQWLGGLIKENKAIYKIRIRDSFWEVCGNEK